MTEIKALIFDFDGLILETEMPVYDAWRQCYKSHGHSLELEQYASCVGSDSSNFDPVLDLESRHGGAIDWELWDAKRRNSIQQDLHNRPPLPGVTERLYEAKEQGLPCAVASSSPRSWVDPLLARLNLSHHFKSTHCLDDVSNPKPDPELFLTAAHHLAVKPCEVLIFEDSLNGLNAALAAGMNCVIIPSPVTKHLVFKGASMRLESLDDLNLNEIMDKL